MKRNNVVKPGNWSGFVNARKNGRRRSKWNNKPSVSESKNNAGKRKLWKPRDNAKMKYGLRNAHRPKNIAG